LNVKLAPPRELSKPLKISVVILTYNRPEMLERNLAHLHGMSDGLHEVIIVDNSSDDETRTLVERRFSWATYLRNEINTGVAGRNRGIREAVGDVVITLDDDVIGLTPEDLDLLSSRFAEEPELGAICFRVLHFMTGDVCNWCHHRDPAVDSLGAFRTYEISEGAVAYRRSVFEASGYYCEDFFISHEGKDLAYRIMNSGFAVCYDGRIGVTHHHAVSGRPDWRRYYYDTRNAIWLAVRNMPPAEGAKYLFVALGSMAVYSVRDGFFLTYLRAVRDGLLGIGAMRRTRTPWTGETRAMCHAIDGQRPGTWRKMKLRLFRRGVEI
jgi:GT2 family glycosyltransferase